MSWSNIDINNLPYGSQITSGTSVLSITELEKPSIIISILGSGGGTIGQLSVYTEPQPWGFHGPKLISPVLGVPVTDCVQAGCDSGGGGSVRPSAGFIYPRRT
jgi:hypothetical protein